jgi:hypothetical protein
MGQFSGQGISPLLLMPIFQDQLVNDLSAEDASPSKKFFTYTVELLIDHNPATSMTFHKGLLG